LPDQKEIALGIFLAAEDRGQDFSRGIVNGRQKSHGFRTVFQPTMETAVNLDQHAGLRFPFSRAVNLCRAPFPFRRDVGLASDSTNRRRADPDSLLFGQSFGEMDIIAVPIFFTLAEIQDFLPDVFG
jgi:hypothetical protein